MQTDGRLKMEMSNACVSTRRKIEMKEFAFRNRPQLMRQRNRASNAERRKGARFGKENG